MSEEREIGGEAEDEVEELVNDRGGDLLGRRDSRLRRDLAELGRTILRGFQDQGERADQLLTFWEAYNCVLNAEQFYDGDAQIFVPIIRDAVNARATRFVNQLFPQGGSYVEAIDGEGSIPHGIVGLLDQYIRAAALKTRMAKALCKNGDIEGQYNLYVDWSSVTRLIVSREKKRETVTIAGMELETPGGEEYDDITVEDIHEARPTCEVLHDSDVLVWPVSVDTIDQALAAGGGVAILRRWSREKVEAMAEAGHLVDDAGGELLDAMDAIAAGGQDVGSGTPPDITKSLAEAVGIEKRGREAKIWEVWKLLPLNEKGRYDHKKGELRICRIFIGPGLVPLGCVRNPHWNDRVPLLSVPTEKIAGRFKGQAPVAPVISLQYEANDAANEGADVAHLGAEPVILRNPLAGKQPLVINNGTVWDIDPNAVRFAEFPDLTPRAIARIQYCISQIFQSLGVNPSMLPQQTSQSRRNQAQIAQEQAVDLLTTAEAVSVLEEGILTPLMEWWIDLDYQFRDRPQTVRLHGTQGVRANLEAIPPQTTRTRYAFRWWGADQARNAAMYQQQIAWINVARGVEPLLTQQGYQLNLVPAIESSAQAIFGPRIGPLVIKDMRATLSLDPKLENQLMSDGNMVPVHMMDDDQQHLIAHQQDRQLEGDPHQVKALHIQAHLRQHAAKSQAMQMAQMQQAMQPQGPLQGAAGARRSRSGQLPRAGAQPVGPQQMKSPAGSIHADRMAGAGGIMMPRNM